MEPDVPSQLLGQTTPRNELRTHGRDVVLVTDVVAQETVSNLPGEDARALALELGDFPDDVVGGDARFASADGARADRPCFVVTA